MEELTKKRNAFLFQGVGAEYHKLIHLLNDEQLEELKYYCSLANKEIGLDLWNYLFNFTTTKHDKMFNDWIAIYTCDYIIYNTYLNFNLKPDVLLGYSMGLITAMACSKSITYEAGLHLLLSVYDYPRLASRKEESMAVIIGLSYNDVDKIILENKLEKFVEIASENNDFCIIISGSKMGVLKLMELAENEGALKVKEINAPYAFHSQHASAGLEKFIKDVTETEVLDTDIPIISSLDQSVIHKAEDLKKELIKNMPGRMYWKTAIEKIGSMGIDNFIEVSLEDSISKFSKMINSNYEFLTYSKILKMRRKQEKLSKLTDVSKSV